MKFYQLTEIPGEPGLLSGLTPWHFEEALRTGSLGTLMVFNYQLLIKIRFKNKYHG